MKAASIKEIRTDLKHRSNDELTELVLRLARFKKENKELLTYLLFESEHEETYIQSVTEQIEQGFSSINTKRNQKVHPLFREKGNRSGTFTLLLQPLKNV